MLEVLVRKRGRQECEHDEIVTVVSAGWQRMICEGCGHLSFRYLAKANSSIDRSRFVRPVDQFAVPG